MQNFWRISKILFINISVCLRKTLFSHWIFFRNVFLSYSLHVHHYAFFQSVAKVDRCQNKWKCAPFFTHFQSFLYFFQWKSSLSLNCADSRGEDRSGGEMFTPKSLNTREFSPMQQGSRIFWWTTTSFKSTRFQIARSFNVCFRSVLPFI